MCAVEGWEADALARRLRTGSVSLWPRLIVFLFLLLILAPRLHLHLNPALHFPTWVSSCPSVAAPGDDSCP